MRLVLPRLVVERWVCPADFGFEGCVSLRRAVPAAVTQSLCLITGMGTKGVHSGLSA